MICSFGAILAWKSDDDDNAAADADDDDYDDDRKSDPYVSPSYAGDTKRIYMWLGFGKYLAKNSCHSNTFNVDLQAGFPAGLQLAIFSIFIISLYLKKCLFYYINTIVK